VIGRVAVCLTPSSASVVSLAPVARASGFGTEFRVMAVTLSAVVLPLGTLTCLRVHNAGTDDLCLVMGIEPAPRRGCRDGAGPRARRRRGSSQ